MLPLTNNAYLSGLNDKGVSVALLPGGLHCGITISPSPGEVDGTHPPRALFTAVSREWEKNRHALPALAVKVPIQEGHVTYTALLWIKARMSIGQAQVLQGVGRGTIVLLCS